MIPIQIKESLDAYVYEHRPTGGFLQAVLENDLFGAVARADFVNRGLIPDIVAYIYTELPSICWGSPKAVKDWLEQNDDS